MLKNKTVKTYIILCFVLLVYLFIVFKHSEKFSFNFTGFACIGDHTDIQGKLNYKLFIFKNSRGYDGQYFLLMCHDLLLNSWPKNHIDVPAYRYQRILYPLLAKLAALGNPEYFQYTLVLINIFSVACGLLIILKMLEIRNLSLWYGFFFPATAGLLLCTLRDLAEPLSAFLMILCFYCYLSKKPFCYCAALGLMFLSKEIMLLLFPVFLYDAFIKKDIKIIMLTSAALFPFLAWQFYLSLKCGVMPWEGGTNNFFIPFLAFLNYFSETLKDPLLPLRYKLLVLLFSISFIYSFILSVTEFLKSKNLFTSAFIIFSLVFVFMSSDVFVEPWSFMRIYVTVSVLLLLNFIHSGSKLYIFPLFLNIIIFINLLWWLEFI